MPSDFPPIRQARPASAGILSPQVGGDQGGQDAAKPDRPAQAPTILNPALRRYWHREGDAQAAPRNVRRQIVQQGMFWAFLLGILVVAALVFDRGITVVEAPRQRLGPVVATPAPSRSADAVLPVVVVRPEVTSAYGNGAVIEVERRARRYGAASAYAVACGRQLPTWPGKVSAALATAIAEGMPVFENNPRVLDWMKEFIQARFRDGQLMAEHGLTVRGKEAICAELPLSFDYTGAQNVVRDPVFRQQ